MTDIEALSHAVHDDMMQRMNDPTDPLAIITVGSKDAGPDAADTPAIVTRKDAPCDQ